VKDPLKKLPNGVVLLSFTSLLTDVASEAIYPLIPLYLTTVLHAPAFSLGLIEGIADATASLLKLMSGIWADRLGRNKLLVFTGYMLSNLTKPLLGVTHSWPQVLVVRWSDRVGKGIRTAPRDAWLAKLAPAEAMNLVFGFHRGMDNLGAVFGPLCAGLFLAIYPGEYRSLFLWTFVPGILATFLVLVTREYGKKQKPQAEWKLSGWWRLPPSLRKYLAIMFLFSIGNSSDVFILLRLKDAGIAVPWIPVLWGAQNLVRSLVSFWSSSLADRFRPQNVICLGWLVFAATYLCFAVVVDKPTLIAIFLLYGLFFGLTEGPERALVARLAPATMKGAAFGFLAMLAGLAALPASLLFGWLWTNIGMPAAFLTGGLIALFSLSLLLVTQP
jgi:MFS family permease